MITVKRYKDCNWREKLVRWRHVIKVPFYAAVVWWKNYPEISFIEAYQVERGWAEFRMEKFSTWSEIKKEARFK